MQWLNVLNNVYDHVSPLKSYICPRIVIDSAFDKETSLSLILFFKTVQRAVKYVLKHVFFNIATIRYNNTVIDVMDEEGIIII